MGRQVPSEEPRQDARPPGHRPKPQTLGTASAAGDLLFFFFSFCLFDCFFFVCLLDEVSEHDDCPHLLFYGPSGSGKKTLIMAVVKQMFGAGAEKVRFFLLNLSLLIYLFIFF